ncbi:SusC/RagA family TonB-linked outer membrane protein [Mangrovibacterium diazotrophicum]|uniref:TonB-linked SusC/RagA family outer membrane protein n=1 Tax=Mangrovibacterium diazotrophicum TaxID=1261403 RepID=A0A419VXC9_9BACT|nr:SusC/RagA family TonB-linked outer membrane protein [Mangrovibacterium diazotrophicum]RKD87883.1 TonB-linked SusC/RagA family outer membrane protein [Mangrovibacterium diazotrophicum]
MRNLLVFLFVFTLQAHSSLYSQSRMTVDLENSNMKELIRVIEKQTSLGFLYDENLESVPVSVKAQNETVENILKEALKKSDLEFLIDHNTILIQKKAESNESDQLQHLRREVSGKILDKDGNPIPGVNVVIVELRQGVATDNYGNFKIMVPNDRSYTLLLTFIGMEEQKIYLGIVDAETQDMGKLVMKAKQSEIGEVLVTGIFNKPKESFTGAATIITKDEIKRSGNRNLLQTLANIDPSFDVQEQPDMGSDPNNTNLAIQIRGASSLPDINDMQLDARNQLNTPLFILDGFEVSMERVLDMNQTDVESVSILKDASATAIYGSRGANGVVVITSSHPPIGKLRVTYNAGLNLEIPDLSSYNLLNAEEKLYVEQLAGMYSSDDPSEQADLLAMYYQNDKAIKEGVNTNWMKIPTQVGVGQYHKLRIGGGDEQFRYDLNASYNQITGAMKGSKRDNVNVGMTLQYIYKKVSFSNLLELGFNKGVNSPYGSFNDYYYMNPYWRPYNEDGTPVTSYTDLVGQTKYNPLYDASLASFSKTDYTSIRNQTTATVNFTPTLKWDSSIGVTQLRGGGDNFTSPLQSGYLQNNIDLLSRGFYTKSSRKEMSYQLSTTLSWGKAFGKHAVFLGANAQVMQSKAERMYVSVKGFTNEKLNDISNGSSYSGTSPTVSESTTRSVGVTATGNYNYNSRYFVDASWRLDGASSFGKNSRFAPFYSVGAAWDVAQEGFIKENLRVLQRFKLRYSYGVTGSLNFSAYQALSTYQYNTDTEYNGQLGTNLLALGNEDLKWQTTYQHNIGLDLTAFNNFLDIDFNYYRKTSDNLIAQASLPYSNGFTSYTENFGEVRNTGFDAMVSMNLVRTSDFNWYVRLGAYHNKNILLKLSEAIKTANEKYEGWQSSDSFYYQYREGESLDALYVLKSPGVDPLTGKVLYEDPETGYVYDHITDGLRKIPVGLIQPKINGRFGSSFRYKGLTLDFTFNVRYGASKLNSSLLTVENSFVRYNLDKRVLGTRWINEGDVTGFKDIASSDNTLANDRFVFKEKTLSMSNINISYNFPEKLLSRYNIQQVTFSAAMSDVFYLSNIKMQRGTDYPYARTPTFNLSVTF